MIYVSFSTGTFTINHHFSHYQHLSYNMTSYDDYFVTLNGKTSMLDIFRIIMQVHTSLKYVQKCMFSANI
jgi:hypothetical protein